MQGLVREIQLAETSDFWIVAAILVVATLGGVWLWFRSLKRVRLIEDTPTSKCRSAAQGYVELIGIQKLLPGDPIHAPLTGRECTWWSFCIEEKRVTYSKGRRQTRWVTIEKDSSEALFLIEDDTGSAVVDPDDAEVTCNTKDVWYGSTRRPLVNGARSSALFGGSFRYTEQRMHAGEPLYAIGHFETHSTHHSPLDRERQTASLLGDWKRDQTRLLARFDSNADGDIDLHEWEQARIAARIEVEELIRKQALDPGVHVMRCPTDGRPFILSVLPETELTRRFRLFALLGLALFFAAGAAAVFAIGVRLAAGAAA